MTPSELDEIEKRATTKEPSYVLAADAITLIAEVRRLQGIVAEKYPLAVAPILQVEDDAK